MAFAEMAQAAQWAWHRRHGVDLALGCDVGFSIASDNADGVAATMVTPLTKNRGIGNSSDDASELFARGAWTN